MTERPSGQPYDDGDARPVSLIGARFPARERGRPDGPEPTRSARSGRDDAAGVPASRIRRRRPAGAVGPDGAAATDGTDGTEPGADPTAGAGDAPEGPVDDGGGPGPENDLDGEFSLRAVRLGGPDAPDLPALPTRGGRRRRTGRPVAKAPARGSAGPGAPTAGATPGPSTVAAAPTTAAGPAVDAEPGADLRLTAATAQAVTTPMAVPGTPAGRSAAASTNQPRTDQPRTDQPPADAEPATVDLPRASRPPAAAHEATVAVSLPPTPTEATESTAPEATGPLARPSAPLPAPLAGRPGLSGRPGRDRANGDGALEPWEWLPVREAAADRAAEPLAGSWRVAFASTTHGGGCTTTTAAAALMLTRLRREPIVAIDLASENADDAGGDPTALAGRVGLRPRATVAEFLATLRDRAETEIAHPPLSLLRHLIGGQVLAGATADEVPGVDVLPTSLARSEPSAAGADRPWALVDAAGKILREGYPLVFLEAGTLGSSPMVRPSLASADVVVLVVPARASAITAASNLLREADGLVGDPTRAPAVIAAVVSTRRGRWSPRTRGAALRLSRLVTAVVRVPYDPRLGPFGAARRPGAGPGRSTGGSAVPLRRVRRGTRRAFVELAAAIVDTCVEAETAAENTPALNSSEQNTSEQNTYEQSAYEQSAYEAELPPPGPEHPRRRRRELTPGVSFADHAVGDGGEDR